MSCLVYYIPWATPTVIGVKDFFSKRVLGLVINLPFITGDYDFLMKRMPDKSYGKGITNGGPDEQRYGAWARVLPAKEQMNFQINPVFVESCKNKNITVNLIYYDAKGKDFSVIINNNIYPVTCKGQNKRETIIIELNDGII